MREWQPSGCCTMPRTPAASCFLSAIRPPLAGNEPLRNSDVFGNPIRGVQGTHFIGALFPAIDHHSAMKTDDRLAASARMGPRKSRVNEARDRAAQHRPTEAQGVAPMLEVGFAHRSRMIEE